MNKGDIVEITIEDISNDGQGIGKACGLAVFVSDTVVGDRIAAELIKLKKNYAIGRMTKMLAPSPYRTDPVCPYEGRCGGCTYQKMKYQGQLALKRKQVSDKLMRLGGMEEGVSFPLQE